MTKNPFTQSSHLSYCFRGENLPIQKLISLFQANPFVVRGEKRKLILEPYTERATYCVFNAHKLTSPLEQFLRQCVDTLEQLRSMEEFPDCELTLSIAPYPNGIFDERLSADTLRKILSPNILIGLDVYFPLPDVIPPNHGLIGYDDVTWFGGPMDTVGYLFNTDNLDGKAVLGQAAERTHLKTLEQVYRHPQPNGITLIGLAYRSNRGMQINYDDFIAIDNFNLGLRLVLGHIGHLD